MGKAFNIIKTDLKLFGRVRKFAPDLVISLSSPIAAHIAFLLNKTCIALEDTECANLVQKSYLFFSNVVITSSAREMHNIISGATLLIGESATMAAEASIPWYSLHFYR